MSQLSQAVIRGLMEVYSAYYDVEEIPGEGPLKALCAYHSRDSQYVLSKKVELWAAESHEYLYLWNVEELEEGAAEDIFARVLSDGEPRIKPHSQHMSTYLTAVVLYESAAPRALEQLKIKNLKKDSRKGKRKRKRQRKDWKNSVPKNRSRKNSNII